MNVSGLLYHGGIPKQHVSSESGLLRTIEHLVQEILENLNTHILFIPHVFDTGTESDRNAIHEIINTIAPQYRSRVHQVEAEYDQNEMKGIISFCDFFAGSRMHSCIAALSQQIPCVGLAYSDKFHGVFDSAQVDDAVIDLREENRESVIRKFRSLYDQRNSSGSGLPRTFLRFSSS